MELKLTRKEAVALICASAQVRSKFSEVRSQAIVEEQRKLLLGVEERINDSLAHVCTGEDDA